MKQYLGLFSIAAFGCVNSLTAQAANITFNYIVNSSGTQLYACDAGLMVPTEVSYSGMSNIMAKYGAYNNGAGPSSSSSPWQSVVLPANTPTGVLTWPTPFKTVVYQVGFTSGSSLMDKLNNIIFNTPDGTDSGELTFNLAAQNYGAKYFIDFCFRESKVPAVTTGSGQSYKYEVKDTVTAVDHVAQSYIIHSAMKLSGVIACDKRDGDYGITDITDTLNANFLGLGVVSGRSAHGPSSFAASNFNTSSTNLFGNSYSFTTSAPVESCIVRYVFEESSSDIRLWDELSANFKIYLDIKNKGIVSNPL